MKGKTFEFFDVTADIGFKSFGNSLEECFENAGSALFNVISNTKDIEPIKKISFKINSEDKISLLYDFLEELLFYHEVEFMLFSKFNVKISKDLNGYTIDSDIYGEEINWNKHERNAEVKAITLHLMNVGKINGIYQARAVLDL